jgi:hypothetical protein
MVTVDPMATVAFLLLEAITFASVRWVAGPPRAAATP